MRWELELVAIAVWYLVIRVGIWRLKQALGTIRERTDETMNLLRAIQLADAAALQRIGEATHNIKVSTQIQTPP